MERLYDYKKGRNTVPKEERLPFDVDKLVGAGVIFITPAIEGNPKSEKYGKWLKLPYSHLVTLMNVEKAKPTSWVHKAITKKAPTTPWRDNFVEKIYDGKYNQILWSLEKLGLDPEDFLVDKELTEEIVRIKEVMGINEQMKVDDFGRLHDEDTKTIYPYKKIKKFVNWFQKEWGDYAAKQGWGIFDSDSELPAIKYTFEPDNNFHSLFQVQKIDSPEEGEALIGELRNDFEADELAKKIGLMLDEYGVVIGWDGELFI